MNVDVKKKIYNMMEKNIDKVMITHDFKRRRNSFNYSRNIGTVKQKIEMIFFSNPSYHPGALAHIYPWLSVCFPEINEIANEMVEENLIDDLKTITIRQPVQIHFSSERWMLVDSMESEKLSEDISDFFAKHTIPLLDELKSINDYIMLYEMQDKRLIMDDEQYIFITSAYILQGNYVKAQTVLEKRFGKPGLRKRYASAFDYLKMLSD